jgi:hypothetical protein
METKKIVCAHCGDNIVGEKYEVIFLYQKYEWATLDEGCFLLLNERGIILKFEIEK